LNGILHSADEFSQSLRDDGITAMKIWPFDAAAAAARGTHISPDYLKIVFYPFEKIR
jgi:hypothetical protein